MALAVRLPRSLNAKVPIGDTRSEEDAEDEEEFEDTGDIDEFLASRGFEFVDVPEGPGNDITDDEMSDGWSL